MKRSRESSWPLSPKRQCVASPASDDEGNCIVVAVSDLSSSPANSPLPHLSSPVTHASSDSCLDRHILSPLATTITDCVLSPDTSTPSSHPSVKELTWHFSTVLAPCLVFTQEDGPNPFCELLLPLAADENASVTHAICAFASAHLELMGLAQADASTEFYNLALSRLASQIEGGEDQEMALATILTLVSYEVLVRERPSDIIEHHLRGAYFLIQELSDRKTPLVSFLERQFRYYDAIVSLSLGVNSVADAPCLGRPTSASEGTLLDPLLGMASDLWPILYRLSGMLPLKKEIDEAIISRQTARTSVLRGEMNTTSQAIESALYSWVPPVLAGQKCDDVLETLLRQPPEVQAGANHALAYRHSALVYLHRAIHGYPQRHRLVQSNTHSALVHCAAAAPTHGLLWPLFTAACEAVDDEDRELAGQAFDALRRRQRMVNIDHAWYVVASIWARSDENLGRGVRADDTLCAWRGAEEALGLKVILS